MKRKKAQSALEFLTTYGWAFLVILIMIAAMAYFDVFNIGDRVPGSCTFTDGLDCTEWQITGDNEIVFILSNQAAGATISEFNITSIDLQGTGCSADMSTDFNQSNWRQGVAETFRVSCSGSTVIAQGERVVADISGYYRLAGRQLNTTFTGRISELAP